MYLIVKRILHIRILAFVLVTKIASVGLPLVNRRFLIAAKNNILPPLVDISAILALTILAGCVTQNRYSGPLEQPILAVEIQNLTPTELLDRLVASTRMDAAAEPMILERRKNYVKPEDIPRLIACLDSVRPCLAVATPSAQIANSLSTEGREAAYLVLGFRCSNYPPTISSQHFEYDLSDIRAWWQIVQREGFKHSDMPVSEPITLTEAEKETAEIDIFEKLFRHLFDFQPSHQRQNAPAYFLAVSHWEQDPAPTLIARFSRHRPSVRPVSVMPQIIIDESGLPKWISIPGVLFYAREIEFVTDGFAAVTADYYEGPRSGLRATFHLRRVGHIWVVMGMSDAMIS